MVKVIVKYPQQEFQDSKCHPWIRVILYVGYAIGIFPWASSLDKPGSYWRRIPSLCIPAGGLAALISSFVIDKQLWIEMAKPGLVAALNIILYATTSLFLLMTALFSGIFFEGNLLFLPSSRFTRPIRGTLISVPPIASFLLVTWVLVEYSHSKMAGIPSIIFSIYVSLIVLILTLGLTLCLLQYADMYDEISVESSKDDVFVAMQRKVLSFQTNFQWPIFALSIYSCVCTFGILYWLIAGMMNGKLTWFPHGLQIGVQVFPGLIALLFLNASAEHLKKRFNVALDRFMYSSCGETGAHEESVRRFFLEKYEPTVDIWGFFTLGSGTLATFLISITTFLVIMVQLLQGEQSGSH